MIHPNKSARILAIQAALDERKISLLSFIKLFDSVISPFDRPFEAGCLFGCVFDTSTESYPEACSQPAVRIYYWWCWWVYIGSIPPILNVHKVLARRPSHKLLLKIFVLCIRINLGAWQ